MYCNCGNIVENKDTGLCASCSAAIRKAERQAGKEKKPIRKIKPVSDSMRQKLKEYKPAKEQHLKEHPDCQVRLIGCQNNRETNSVHHAAKRGKNLANKETFLTACEHCHHQIEFVLSAAERRERGYLRTV